MAKKLTKDIGTKARKISDTRWKSMSKVASWFRKNLISSHENLSDKNPPCAPPLKWWIFICFVSKVSNEETITLRSLESLTTLVSQQREGILRLSTIIGSWFNALDIGSKEELNQLDREANSVSEDRKHYFLARR